MAQAKGGPERMTMHKVIGKMGSGKTLFTTYVGFLNYAMGRRVISNYNLTFPSGYPGTVETLDPEMLYEITNDELVDCVLLLDEIWVFMDSWLSGSKQNRLLSYLMLQSRKRDVDIFGTAQSNMQFANRFRNNVDYRITTKMHGDYLIWKLWEETTGHLIDKFSVNGAYLYDLYNTKEIIDPAKWQMKGGKKRGETQSFISD